MKNESEICLEDTNDFLTIEEIKKKIISDEELNEVLRIVSVLNDFNRIKIIYALSEAELCVHELADLLDLSQSATSHHLRILRNSKLVKFRKEEKHVFYSILDEKIVDILNILNEHIKLEKNF